MQPFCFPTQQNNTTVQSVSAVRVSGAWWGLAMSYVRLLRLPPQFEAVGATRCWRRQISARGGRPNNLRDDCAELYARHAFLRGDDTRLRVGREIGQGAVGSRRHGSRIDVADIYAREISGKGTASSTSSSGPALTACDRLDPRPSAVRAPLMYSTSARAPLALWGATETGTHSGGAWGNQQAQLRLLREFSSVPPEQQDSKIDSSDHHNARKTFPGQRAFVGGLLKPSDVSKCLGSIYLLIVTMHDGSILRCLI